MAVRPFLAWPDPRLKTVCDPVTGVDDAVRAVWQDMLDSMYAMPGVGLAAPQIGVMLRLAVLDCSDASDSPVRLANPELIEVSAETAIRQEGSPNLPGVWEKVERPARARVRYLDEDGEQVEREFEGLWATSVQHQIDHLNGKLFIDYLGSVKRSLITSKMKKFKRERAKA